MIQNNYHKLDLLDKCEIKIIQEYFFEIINEIKADYMNDLSFDDFKKYYIDFESVVMKAIGYRFYYKILKEGFFEKIEYKIKDFFDEKYVVYLRHPIFYTRIIYPEKDFTNLPLLSSQPHFDRSFNLHAYTVWLAMDEIDCETGGLCFFNKNEKIDELFEVEWGQKNKYNSDLYKQNHEDIDPIIINYLIQPKLSAGQAFLFDSNTLHCGVRPRSKERLSFDFRFIKKSELKKTDERTGYIFELFDKNPDEILAKNLFMIGDHIASKKIKPNIENLLPVDLVITALDIKKRYQKLSWRLENSFI
jgi:hypothetical protein